MIKLTPFVLVLLFSCASPRGNQKLADVTYHRKEWAHWTDVDKDCQDTRHEILIERSKETPLLDRRGCRVKTGSWDDYYFPEILTRSKDIDIDHLIPLKHAHSTGGSVWTKDKFANDPDNLVITNKRFNRQKGAKGIHQWLPSHKNYACKYIRDWIKIKRKYSLLVTDEEKKTVTTSGCSF